MFITMFKPKLCLFCLIEVLCIFLCSGNSNMKSCVETDKQALLKLKDEFIDKWSVLSSCKSEVDCCQWNGISCNNLTRHVFKLDLQASNYSTKLKGNIDSSLCELQHLTSLDLSFNDFEGQVIPKCIGSLGHLRELKLRKANLVSTVPSGVQNLSNLHTLDLGGNCNLISNSLEWVSHLSSLRYLDLALIDLSQATDWQLSISKVPSLIELHLNYNQLPQVNPQLFSNINSSRYLKVLTLRGNDLNSSTLSWVFNFSKVFVHLDLSDNSLRFIAPHVFAKMNSLKYLDLSDNSLRFIAPHVSAKMTSLEYLDLSNNELESSTVKLICNLCQLKELLLSYNKLFGRLSDWIQKLYCVQNLMKLDLSGNPFIGGPFPNMSTFSSLVTLRLRNTSLCGSIPQSFGRLHNLEFLDLSYNNLSGLLPEFTQLLSLKTLDLSNNEFNGTLPHTIGQLSSLNRLLLSSNNLSGVISEAHLSTLYSLKVLDVSKNLISFNFNSNWVPSFQLHQLSTSSCSLGPKFPLWLKNQRGLKLLDISYGEISDSIPEWFCDLSPSLTFLNISHNKIHGALPKVTSQQGLRFLDMSSNLLSGRLPDCWGQFEDLEVLNLGQNHFSGIIPNSIGTLNRIKSIHLNNNNLSGEISFFMPSSKLKLIDFRQNNLEGELPTWVGDNLPNLIVLSLQANKLQGIIPTSLCKLVHLHILDLSHNNITGIIPHCLKNLIALSNEFSTEIISYSAKDNDEETVDPVFIDSAILVWKGIDYEFGLKLGFLTMIDLSCNYLQGMIPNSITTLSALISLNLSRNNLIGVIPGDMGQMKNLESLDLSSNSLSGVIPASLSNLRSLIFLDLSSNNLSGKIPLGFQLQSFDASSYIGNQGLYGCPLTRCSGDANFDPDPDLLTKSSQNIDADKDDDLTSLGFYLSMVFGFIVGFWGVCGTLTIKNSWRQAYFQFFDHMHDWIYVQVHVFASRMKEKISRLAGGWRNGQNSHLLGEVSAMGCWKRKVASAN